MPNSSITVRRIISGGQTGVDRAALDAAAEVGLKIGGTIPLGRWAEDGPISARYVGLEECDSAVPAVRTRLNVMNSDATLIVTHGKLAGGSALTAKFARELGKPFLHIDLAKMSIEAAKERVCLWLGAMEAHTLNIAGPRASKDPEIYDDVLSLVHRVFGK